MKVIIFIDNGFEEIEALSVVDLLRRSNIEVDLVSANNQEILSGSHAIKVSADKTISNIKDILEYAAIILPGGMPNAALLRDNEKIISFIQEMHDDKRLIATICAGPITLEKAKIVDNKNVTVYPGFEDTFNNSNVLSEGVVVDENIITAKGVNYALDFALMIIEKLLDKEVREKIEKDILRK